MRWVFSHLLRSKWIIAMAIFGAIGNAAMATVVPRSTGRAFDAIASRTDALNVLFWAAIAIALAQSIRAFIQYLRNFGNEAAANIGQNQ